MAASIEHQLRQVGTQFADGKIDHPTARMRIVSAIQGHFRCSRVSYWYLYGEPGDRVLECVVSSGVEADTHAPGQRFLESAAPDYIQALIGARMYVCEDTLTDPNFASLRERYLKPNASRALLDAALSANGKMIGVLCLEQVGGPRKWTRPEVMAALRIATGISMFVARFNAQSVQVAAVQ
ncbi:GAF domain-containing protein [Piscinibacter terrae]|uniref:GAF domain-containing protein n=1 Tax=Piscinibacter terrae TaxID=2496871 RepID=A0A3N7HJE2_9BURK|nr:GAF domain-containing protein [Albitalea terrae]RQP22174.1 GAF domain-containing protein [Albitalea terrae]